MQKNTHFGPYKGHWLTLVICGPLLVYALWRFTIAVLALIGDQTESDPTEGLIAGGVFALGSACVLAFSHFLGVTDERDKAIQAQFPKEPWKWKPQWHQRDIKSGSKLAFLTMAGVTTVFVIFSILATPKLLDLVFNEKEYFAAIFLMFPFVSIFALHGSYKMYTQWKRFEGTTFRMASLPAAIGHVLKGQLILKDPPPKGSVFKFQLLHAKITVSGSGKNRRRSEKILWEDAQDIPAKQGSYSTHFRLPVAFKLPEKAQSSDWADSDNEYLWKLIVKADLPGPDYEQSFEIPVYDPKHHSFHVPNYLNEDGEIAGNIYQDSGDWRETHVQVTKTLEGETYYNPPARHKGTALTMTIVALFLGAIPFAIIASAGPIIGSIFSLVLGLFALVFGGIALDLWFHKIFLVANKGQFNLRYGLFARKQANCTIDEIASLKISSTMNSGTTSYYDIVAKLKNGKSLKLAIYIEDKRDAIALRDKIATEIGL